MKYTTSESVLAALESSTVVYKSEVGPGVYDHLAQTGAVSSYNYEPDLEVIILTEEYKNRQTKAK